MNTGCAYCNKPITHKRSGEILCKACEAQWWIEHKAIYERKIKELNLIHSGDKHASVHG